MESETAAGGFELFALAPPEEKIAPTAAMDSNKRYAAVTPEMLKDCAEMVPGAAGQK